ncbi:hypothetical protein BB560_002502 [Smittium megazygosporum]|uniref:F-box domain-containing protein n=1 Tax=Smittium megazygosporum TaxID=133381 RepID=A0A2T9ZEJ9_9FUNG|nr:hypothetical protein BB560_002502 [Smittium megazygosporum]
MTITNASKLVEFLQSNDRARKNIFGRLDLKSILEVQLTCKDLEKYCIEEFWYYVEADHYYMKNFSSLLKKNANLVTKLLIHGSVEKVEEVIKNLDKLEKIKEIKIKDINSAEMFNDICQKLELIEDCQLEALDLEYVANIFNMSNSTNEEEIKKAEQEIKIEKQKFSLSGFSKFDSLKTLNIVYCGIQVDEIKRMFDNMSSCCIEKLCIIPEEPLTSELVSVISSNCSEDLVSLELGHIPDSSIQSYEQLLKSCKKLHKLYINGIFSDNEVNLFESISPKDIKLLKTLQIGRSNHSNQFNKFLDQDWNHVDTLVLNECIVTHETASIIASKFSHVKNLELLNTQARSKDYIHIVSSLSKSLLTLQVAAIQRKATELWPSTLAFENLYEVTFAACQPTVEMFSSVFSKNNKLSRFILDDVYIPDSPSIFKKIIDFKLKNDLETKNLYLLSTLNIRCTDPEFYKGLLRALNSNIISFSVINCEVEEEEFEGFASEFPAIQLYYSSDIPPHLDYLGDEDDFDFEGDDSFGFRDGPGSGMGYDYMGMPGLSLGYPEEGMGEYQSYISTFDKYMPNEQMFLQNGRNKKDDHHDSEDNGQDSVDDVD